VTVGILTLNWDLKLPRGGQQSVRFALKQANGITPFPVNARTFEYVVRPDANGTGTPLVSITSALTAQGQLVIDTVSSIITMNLLAVATSGLTTGNYYHALWMDPGQSTAFNWFAGKFILQPASQP
jgi:hypothetical protein